MKEKQYICVFFVFRSFNIQQLKGVLLVLGGAVSYGILATIVKYANILGIHTSVLIFMQFAVGLSFLLIYSKIKKRSTVDLSQRSRIRLIAYGTTFGMTSIFYYLSIRYIPVSLGIILLMQSIWMSLVLESLLWRKIPSRPKIVGFFAILAGTIFATNVLFELSAIDWRGIVLGLLAASSYTVSMHVSNHLETQSSNHVRSKYFVLGGFLFVTCYWNFDIFVHFNSFNGVFWGALLAVFGTIIPPLLFTKGMPIIGIGLGAIIASVEIPVSILSAHLVLDERINAWQWIGVLMILQPLVLFCCHIETEKKILPKQDS